MTNLILAIDTSCDDTSAAVTSGTTILSNVIASQTQLHKEYGGVFPTVAKQAHKENITPVIAVALKRAKVSIKDISAIAVTQGPGLAPALEIGIDTARELAKKYNKPLIAINHLEGHLLSVLAKPKQRKLQNSNSKNQPVIPSDNVMKVKESHQQKMLVNTPHSTLHFPALSLIISGGNTLFVLVKSIGEYEVLGSTIDDAAGECLDKVGRMLGLGYPAGPVIEQFAKLGNSKAYEFPLPMTTSGDFNLSFSGLKTQARNNIEKIQITNFIPPFTKEGIKLQESTSHIQSFDNAQGKLTKQQTYDFCASFQFAVFRHITYKLKKILEKYEIKEVWLGGGVAANITLRSMIRSSIKEFKPQNTNYKKIWNFHSESDHPLGEKSAVWSLPLKVPYTKKLTVDNAAMIGIAAGFKLERKEFVKDLENMERVPKMKLG